MAINFPTSLDNFTNPSSGNTLDSPSHSLQHSDINDAVEALEAKLGIGASPAGSATSGYVLMAGTGGTTTWSVLPSSGALTQVVPTSVAVGSGSGSVDANGAVTFSGASSVSLNGCFTSTYDNYKITLTMSAASATAILKMRLRASGSDTIGTSYQSSVIATRVSGATFNANAQNANYGYIGFSNLNAPYPALQLTIFNPKNAIQTNWSGTGSYRDGTSNFFGAFGGVLDDTTSYDGFTIVPDSGTFAGTIRVYGLRN